MKITMLHRALLVCAVVALVPACSGGPINTTPVGPSALSATAGADGSYVYTLPASGTYTGLLGIPASASTFGSGATVTLTSTLTDPTGLQSAATARRAQSVPAIAPYDYLSMTWLTQVSANTKLDFIVTPAKGVPAAGTQYYEEFDDTTTTAGWQLAYAGPFTSDGSTVTFYFPAPYVYQAGHAYVMGAYTVVSTPSPSPTPAGPIALSASSVSLLAAGAAGAQSVTASEPSYSGSFVNTGTACAGIATIAISNTTVTVTGVAAGSCTATIADSFGQTAALAITVTTSGITAN